MIITGIILILFIFCPQTILATIAGATLGNILAQVTNATDGTPFIPATILWFSGLAITLTLPAPDPKVPFENLAEVIGPYVADSLLGLGLVLLVISLAMMSTKLMRKHRAT